MKDDFSTLNDDDHPDVPPPAPGSNGQPWNIFQRRTRPSSRERVLASPIEVAIHLFLAHVEEPRATGLPVFPHSCDGDHKSPPDRQRHTSQRHDPGTSRLTVMDHPREGNPGKRLTRRRVKLLYLFPAIEARDIYPHTTSVDNAWTLPGVPQSGEDHTNDDEADCIDIHESTNDDDDGILPLCDNSDADDPLASHFPEASDSSSDCGSDSSAGSE